MLMPVFVLVRQVLRIDADLFAALIACVGKHLLVAFDAVGVLVAQYITLTGQRLVALPAAEMTIVPVLAHRLCVFAGEN